MSNLVTIDSGTIQVGMIILFIHNSRIITGKVIEISPQLKITMCNNQYKWGIIIHRTYFLPILSKPTNGIYLCPGEIADRLVFSNLPTNIMEVAV